MKILKSILKYISKVLTYAFLTTIFFVGILVDNAQWFYRISVVLLLFLGIRIIVHIFKMIKLKKKYVTRVIALIINVFLFLGILDFMGSYEEYKNEVINSIVVELMNAAESEEYNEKFKEVNYKNYKILYNENSEEAINLIQRYLDEVEIEGKKLFNMESTSELTIKFDYDEEVFKNRDNLNENTLGYYVSANKTIYIYINDAYVVFSNKDGFKSTFFHEYTHHYMREYLESNNVDSSRVPTWFDEGIASYMGNASSLPIKCVDGLDISFIQFSKMQDQIVWREFEEGENYIQSEYMINKIVEKKSEEAILQIILKLKDVNFEEAFKEVIGYSLDEFEQEIENDINNSKEYCEHIHETKERIYYNDELIEGIKKYLDNNIHNIDAYEDLACRYFAQNKDSEARKVIEEGIRNNPNESVLEEIMEYYTNYYE